MERRQVLGVLMVGLLVAAGGCGRGIGEAVGGIRGGQGSCRVLKAAPPVDVGAYQRFELARIADGMEGLAPGELFSALPGEFAKALADKKIPNAASGKTLLIRGEVIHYEDAGMVNRALGPLEQVVARVEYVDKASGKVLALANCVGRTKDNFNVGPQSKAEGLARGIVRWIDERYPKDKRLED